MFASLALLASQGQEKRAASPPAAVASIRPICSATHFQQQPHEAMIFNFNRAMPGLIQLRSGGGLEKAEVQTTF